MIKTSPSQTWSDTHSFVRSKLRDSWSFKAEKDFRIDYRAISSLFCNDIEYQVVCDLGTYWVISGSTSLPNGSARIQTYCISQGAASKTESMPGSSLEEIKTGN